MMRNEQGFTLIEVVMVIVVLAIAGTGILMYFAGLSGRPDAVTLAQAAALAQEKMERLTADKKANGFNTIVSETPATLPAPFDRFTRGSRSSAFRRPILTPQTAPCLVVRLDINAKG